MRLFTNLLCVISTSDHNGSTLERAISLAENNQAQLTVVDVVPHIASGIRFKDRSSASRDLRTEMMQARLRDLQSLTKPYQSRIDIEHDVLIGTGFLEIIRKILRDGHDLLIKSAENPSFIERIFGSDDMQLLRACPCPVLISHSNERTNYKNILAAVDFDIDFPLDQQNTDEKNLNQKILELSCSLALSDFSELNILHVWDSPGEMTIRAWSNNPDAVALRYTSGLQLRHQSAMNVFQKSLREHLGTEAYDYLAPQFHLRHGTPSTVIPETAKRLQADLVVMGTTARTGISGLLIGNTAEAILEQLTCSVLAVKPTGFVSPIKLTE